MDIVLTWLNLLENKTNKYPTNDQLKKIIESDGKNIIFIKEPTDELKILAAKKSGLRYIESPSQDMIRCAVESEGTEIKYVDNPSRDLCRTAINSNPLAINYIEHNLDNLMWLVLNYEEPYQYIDTVSIEPNIFNIIDYVVEIRKKVYNLPTRQY